MKKILFVSALFCISSAVACGIKPSSTARLRDQASQQSLAVPSAPAQSTDPFPSGRTETVPVSLPAARNEARERLRAFETQFVTIPAGELPDGVQVSTFQADRYPTTRELWNEIMGRIPVHVPRLLGATWNQCPRCPVTHVSWDDDPPFYEVAEVQDFLRILNERLRDSNCTYDLPTDPQLWYMIRADITGTNTDRYSTGVTESNVDQYIFHNRNSNHEIQAVGQPNRLLNAFGIELGNVWKMSKDPFDPTDPSRGRAVRGGSWYHSVGSAESYVRLAQGGGNRANETGFSLVRTCR